MYLQWAPSALQSRLVLQNQAGHTGARVNTQHPPRGQVGPSLGAVALEFLSAQGDDQLG